jgi:hypothetical protein
MLCWGGRGGAAKCVCTGPLGEAGAAGRQAAPAQAATHWPLPTRAPAPPPPELVRRISPPTSRPGVCDSGSAKPAHTARAPCRLARRQQGAAPGPLGPWAPGLLGSWAPGLLGPWAPGPLGRGFQVSLTSPCSTEHLLAKPCSPSPVGFCPALLACRQSNGHPSKAQVRVSCGDVRWLGTPRTQN